MNEVKRQLDKKLGDTSDNVRKIQQHVEQNKRASRPPKKDQSHLYYMALAVCILLIAPISYTLIKPYVQQTIEIAKPSVQQTAIVGENQNELGLYFKQDGDIAYFKGTGNEYASFKETTTWLSDEFVQLLIETDATTMQEIYKIEKDAIIRVYERNAEEGVIQFTEEQLQQFDAIETILQSAVSDEQVEFDNKVAKKIETFLTPMQTFINVIEVTTNADGHETIAYYAKNYGLIAEKFSVEDIIYYESYLTSMNEQKELQRTYDVSIFNTATGQFDVYPLSALPFLDALYPYKNNGQPEQLSYTPIVENDTNTLATIRTVCTNAFCDLFFVIKDGNQFEIIQHTTGAVKQVTYNVDKTIVAIVTEMIEQVEEGQSVMRAVVDIFNTSTFERLRLNNESFNDYPQYPIEHIQWIDDKTLKILTANVSDSSFEQLLQWEKNREFKEVIVEITH
jgi:hypothetical protein